MQCLVKTSAPIPYPPLHVCMRLISVPASWSRSALFCQVAWLEAPPDIDTESWCIFSLGWYLIMSVKKEYRTCAIIRRGLYIFYPIFKNHSLFLRRFFQKILSLWMAYIQERLVIKRGLWWRRYGSLKKGYMRFFITWKIMGSRLKKMYLRPK